MAAIESQTVGASVATASVAELATGGSLAREKAGGIDPDDRSATG
jgi:hypothetical protein